MDCGSCGESNRADARFCAACAAPFELSCSSCGSTLSANARFCDQCATPVGTPAPETAGANSDSEAVRKTVTVLFADMVGSTAYEEQVDPETAREAIGRYHATAQDVIEAHDGTLAKFIGDGVMAVFGIPEVAEDDAARAIAAGLELQRRLAEFGEQIGARHSVKVGFRVGINTGEVVIGTDDSDLVGDALNVAARLEAECEPGQVVVGEQTWRLTRSAFTFEPLGAVSVKGRDEPVEAHRAIPQETNEDEQTPFVGRTSELAELQSVYAMARSEQAARLATVIGSPGLGKTRLAQEFAVGLGDESHFVELRCDRSGTATFTPVVDLLRDVGEMELGLDDDQVLSRLRTVIPATEPEAERIVGVLAAFVGVGSVRSTEDSFWAVRRLLEILAREKPVVLVIDDIQWAEPLFLDLLEHLVEWVTTAP